MSATLGASEALSVWKKLAEVLDRRRRNNERKEMFERAILEQKQNLDLKGQMMSRVATKDLERIIALPLSLIGPAMLGDMNKLVKVAGMLRDPHFAPTLRGIFEVNYVPLATTIVSSLEAKLKEYSQP